MIARETLPEQMESWEFKNLPWRQHAPEILSSTDEGRAIIVDLPVGESLQEHQVHERVWLIVIDGDVNISTDAKAIKAQPGMLIHFEPGERHEVTAHADSRLLLLLTPWPGPGHPGTMTLEQKADVRHRAAQHLAD